MDLGELEVGTEMLGEVINQLKVCLPGNREADAMAATLEKAKAFVTELQYHIVEGKSPEEALELAAKGGLSIRN